MLKLSSFAAAAASASLVSCIITPPPPPPDRPAYGPDYDISPVPPPSQPPQSTFSDSGVPQQPAPTPPAPQGPPPPPAANGSFPVATRTVKPNEVLSPYEPYNVIDIAGFKTGELARDPSNNKIFRVP